MTDTPEINNDDPRMGFAVATSTTRELMDATTPEQMTLGTPCSEYTVKDLLEHQVLVMQRVATIGNGGHWSSITEESVAAGLVENGHTHAEAFGVAAHEVMNAWTDPAKLEQTFEVPWGELPGAPLIYTYTAELACHAWDLATATSQSVEIPDDMLQGALFAAKMIPSEGREDPAMPFDPVVDPGPEAPALLQLAGWFGRNVT